MKITVKKKLKEISAMGGGAVGGHASDREKKDLDEISQSSGLTGHNLFPKSSAEDEHAGHVERARHQKIKNVMKFDEKTTIKIKTTKKLNENRTRKSLDTAMKKLNIEAGEQLGRGAYGTVFAGISDDYGPVAIKMMRRSLSAEKEVRNYRQINNIRAQSGKVRKHFPEVYHIDYRSDPRFVFVVMEILEVQEGYQQETINILFGGLSARLAPWEDEREMTGKFRNRSNRVYVLFKNEDSQKVLLQNMYNDFGPDLDFLQGVAKEFFGWLDNYVSYVKSTDAAVKEIKNMGISSTAEDYLFVYRNLLDAEIKDEFKTAPWYLTFVLRQLQALKEKDPSGVLFKAKHEMIIRYWLMYYRISSIIGLENTSFSTDGMDKTGVEKEQWQAFQQATSIKQALKELKDDFNVHPRDMHDQNVMIRPETGDVVIVDLGLFKIFS